MTGTRFARGDRAWGECARSGRKMLLKDLVPDGRFPNLLVDPRWREEKHPLDRPARPSPDAQALKRPAPSRDNDGGTTATPSDFLDALPGGGYGFGGGS